MLHRPLVSFDHPTSHWQVTPLALLAWRHCPPRPQSPPGHGPRHLDVLVTARYESSHRSQTHPAEYCPGTQSCPCHPALHWHAPLPAMPSSHRPPGPQLHFSHCAPNRPMWHSEHLEPCTVNCCPHSKIVSAQGHSPYESTSYVGARHPSQGALHPDSVMQRGSHTCIFTTHGRCAT